MIIVATRYLNIPDPVWANASLSEGAKILWCHMNMNRSRQETYTYKRLRESVGICHNSITKYLRQLTECNLIEYKRDGSTIQYTIVVPEHSSAISLPTDLLFASTIPHGAKWVWGVIRRLGQCGNYQLLCKLTSCCHESLLRYLDHLLTTNWIAGNIRKQGRRFRVQARAVNPVEEKQRADIAHIEARLALAASQAHYSKGQCLMALMVKAIAVPSEQLQNVKMTGLENNLTSGPLELDLYIPAYKVALEFQGPQHDGPTERYPGAAAYKSRRQRDLSKKGICMEMRLMVVDVRAGDLEFGRLRKFLEGLVPLRECPDDERHVYEYLERVAAAYRRKSM